VKEKQFGCNQLPHFLRWQGWLFPDLYSGPVSSHNGTTNTAEEGKTVVKGRQQMTKF